ncbi:hypothetical protein C9374_014507 [Naegleria lovaniensis]|uniref:Lysine--tRNA ligase n=1 Tax=Naegleria lovaniensis TaxID=51637 RepID=A0AA88GUG6_NAELO|nr:uncharacterized protein C9374_014507 [Naegleria lovaniensis]KAG2389107.1 hypothetical protein C9374_014507 [Naegleria lovaniensis]
MAELSPQQVQSLFESVVKALETEQTSWKSLEEAEQEKKADEVVDRIVSESGLKIDESEVVNQGLRVGEFNEVVAGLVKKYSEVKPQTKSAKKKLDKRISSMEKKLEKKKTQKGSSDSTTAIDEESLDPSKYYEIRKKTITELEKEGFDAFPHKFQVDTSVPEFIKNYSGLAAEERKPEVKVSLAGRILTSRPTGKLVFYTIRGEGDDIQVMSGISDYAEGDEAFKKIHSILRRGDIIGINGFPGKSKKGELSIIPTKIVLLTPCFHMLPKEHYGLTNMDTRYRQRYLDLIMNKKSRDIFVTRSKIIAHLRTFLNERDFLEVETPMMNMIPGGANARPFTTFHNDLNMLLYMRISPELYLKQLVVGGLERVYEIGKNFRNEGIDLTHNPEFTACEFYMAYADYNDLMRITEELLSEMALVANGKDPKNLPQVVPDEWYMRPFTFRDGKDVMVNFRPPYRRLPMISSIEEHLKVKIPTDLESEETRLFLVDLLKKHNVDCSPPMTTARMLDKLVGEFLEPQCINPTFITEHPQIMSPLAKWHRSNKVLTERFELMIIGKEVCNAYTELNQPFIQRERFEDQVKQKDAGDNEAQFMDESFCTALEYGLPPTGGWGIGLDRLTMILSNNYNIKEVILFPAQKPETNEAQETTQESQQ